MLSIKIDPVSIDFCCYEREISLFMWGRVVRGCGQLELEGCTDILQD